MSRIGLKPIEIPDGINITLEEKSRYGGQKVTVKGPLGELSLDLRRGIKCSTQDKNLLLARDTDLKSVASLHGLYRTLISNMVTGVQQGFEKKLEIVGIGYKAEVRGTALEMVLGATHPYTVEAPKGIAFEVIDKVNITIKGIDKQLVGETAARIRGLLPPEPYKGKGIRYANEYVRRKAGKTAKGSTE